MSDTLQPINAAPTTDTAPEFNILNFIGRGSYGDVHLANDPAGNLWAVKIVYRASFSEERPYLREFKGVRAYVPVSLASDHLLKILYVGQREEQGCFYYIMELADDLQNGRQIDPSTYACKS